MIGSFKKIDSRNHAGDVVLLYYSSPPIKLLTVPLHDLYCPAKDETLKDLALSNTVVLIESLWLP